MLSVGGQIKISMVIEPCVLVGLAKITDVG